jgi:hypothetical protein
MLKALPPTQRKQLLDGNWDVNEGAAFTEFISMSMLSRLLTYLFLGIGQKVLTTATPLKAPVYGPT